MSISYELDARGLLCPLPVLKTRKRMQQLPAGACLTVLTDDPAAAIDMPHFCHEAGHVIVDSREVGPELHYTIRKSDLSDA